MANVFSEADEEQARARGWRSVLRCLHLDRIEAVVIVGNMLEGFFQHGLVLIALDARHVFRQVEHRLGLCHDAHKVPEQLVPHVGRVAASDGAEPLARRPADDSHQLTCLDVGLTQDVGGRQRRDVRVDVARLGEVALVRFICLLVDFHGRSQRKPRSRSAKRQAPRARV
ncbi:hypothetical protein D3C71_1459080 [compost metagenome]